jgi:hypothetical protein
MLAGLFQSFIICYTIACATLALCFFVNEWTHLDVFWQEL